MNYDTCGLVCVFFLQPVSQPPLPSKQSPRPLTLPELADCSSKHPSCTQVERARLLSKVSWVVSTCQLLGSVFRELMCVGALHAEFVGRWLRCPRRPVRWLLELPKRTPIRVRVRNYMAVSINWGSVLRVSLCCQPCYVGSTLRPKYLETPIYDRFYWVWQLVASKN